MSVKETVREHRSDAPGASEVEMRERDGWRLVAVEWERVAAASEGAAESTRREVPYGMRPSTDGHYLQDDSAELEVLRRVLSLVVDDVPLSEVAATLNDEGFRDRRNRPWTQSTLFDLLPRIVEAGAEILRSEDWSKRARRLEAV